ncbi:sigma factor-like helix-turn-helix DNA-binding protein [Nocardioides dongkuii]|uniref:sigma factor-like helix-turn-helix DNA-binding protein n=1 Tax=Nocardioides dongkuii TaxID=2760089 RepID=UPI0015FD4268|nr:sigma factor-like helix-turn-helix DNA-binding protein [Nocardioides dongkuii]
MRADDDLTAYAGARWPVLVRTLVLVGCPDPLAPDVALDALARSRRSWADVARGADPDTLVLGAVLAAWAARRRTEWWVGLPAPEPDPEPDPDREPAEAALDRLPGPAREAVVLHDVAGLGADRVAEVLEVPVAAVRDVLDGWTGSEDLRRAAEAVPVLAAPDDAAVAARAGTQGRGRRRRTAAAVGAGALVVAGLAAWTWTSGDDDPAPPDDPDTAPARAEVVRAENPVEVAWWADGVLHLPTSRVPVPAVRSLVGVGPGAVIDDGRGGIALVEHDGDRTELGRAADGSSLVGSGGWAAWRDPSGDLVLVDLDMVEEIDRVGGTDLEPVAIDGGWLYYNEGDTSWRARPFEESARVSGYPLLDVAGGTKVFQRGPTSLLVVRSQAPPGLVRPGRGARLSDDGGLLLTSDRGGGGALRLYDVGSGTVLPSGLEPGEVPVSAGLGRRGTLTYVVGPAVQPVGEDGFSRLSLSVALSLRTCTPYAGACEDVARLSGAAALPVVSH